MLVKLALGNVQRSARDFSVYFLTLMCAVCLLYSFLASADYLLALDLRADQRTAYAQAGGVLQAFAVFIGVIFCFLLGYANAFLLRRRKRELGMYMLLGLMPRHVSFVLVIECLVVGVVALAGGLAMGYVLSPLFGAVAAFVFGAPWRPELVFSRESAISCAGSFAVISMIAAATAVRGVMKCPLAELMCAGKAPDRLRFSGVRSMFVQKVAAAILLALVWGTCLLNPGYFIVFIIPMGFIALFGTYFLIRVIAVRAPERLRRHVDRYWSGLMPFTVRQLEARAESGAMAASAVCVLLAASMCMTIVGLAFSIGMRLSEFIEGADMLLPVAYACVFYGASFLVAAAAVLALQQLSQALDAKARYRALAVLGAPPEMMQASMRWQVGICFGVPAALACVHCVFGFTLIGIISIMMEAEGSLAFMVGVLALTGAVLVTYYAVTVAACKHQLTFFASLSVPNIW